MNSALTPTKLSAECRVLVAAARPKLSTEQAELLRSAITPELNWDRLHDLASWHGLTPLLSRHLLDQCVDLLPVGKADELGARSGQHGRRTIFDCAELVRILTRLQAAGVSAVPFKGPVLAAQIYGEANLREFADLDILCRPEDAARADEVLTQAGYVAEVPLAAGHEKYYMRSECDRVYVYPETGTHLELHWAITPPYFSFPLPAEELIERAGTVDLYGVAVKSFSAEDLLLVLCVNGAKEMWEKLEWVCAVSTLLTNNPGIDWRRVETLAQRTGSCRMLLIGLGLARDIFGAVLPPAWAEVKERDRAVHRLIVESKAWLFADHFQNLRPDQLTKFRLRARERRRDRWRYLLLRAITPTHQDLAIVRLPRLLLPLYYLARPIRLAGKLVRPRSSGGVAAK